MVAQLASGEREDNCTRLQKIKSGCLSFKLSGSLVDAGMRKKERERVRKRERERERERGREREDKRIEERTKQSSIAIFESETEKKTLSQKDTK